MRTSVVHSSQSDNAALIFQAIPTSDGECSEDHQPDGEAIVLLVVRAN